MNQVMATPSVLDYAPNEVALVLHQGDDWEETFAFRNTTDPPGEYWDLTGWTGTCQIRDAYADADDTEEPLAELECTGSTAGMTVYLTGAQSETLPKKCKWELELTTPAGRRRTWLTGPVTVEREVAR
jgi:hypothetical protein